MSAVLGAKAKNLMNFVHFSITVFLSKVVNLWVSQSSRFTHFGNVHHSKIINIGRIWVIHKGLEILNPKDKSKIMDSTHRQTSTAGKNQKSNIVSFKEIIQENKSSQLRVVLESLCNL